jgi:hypothetical protein
MDTNGLAFEPDVAATCVENWLTARLLSPSAIPDFGESAAEQLATVPLMMRSTVMYEILSQRPALAHAVRRLTLVDQLKLSLELARASSWDPSRDDQDVCMDSRECDGVHGTADTRACASQRRGRCQFRRPR